MYSLVPQILFYGCGGGGGGGMCTRVDSLHSLVVGGGGGMKANVQCSLH